jgi:FkbM family methyltransferase
MMSPRQLAHALVWTKRHLMGQYPVDEIAHLKPFLAPDDICFDVGAHGGMWSIALAKLVKKGHVYAFEALPYYADVLTMTCKLLGRRNITVINRAVTDEDETVSIVWKNSSGNRLAGKTHIAGIDEHSRESVDVQSVSLDVFCQDMLSQKVRFVKMDIEGTELFALRGATQLLQTERPLFYCELGYEHCRRYGYVPSDVFEFFVGHDYLSYIISLENGLVPVNASSYQERDVLFVPSETKVPSQLV